LLSEKYGCFTELHHRENQDYGQGFIENNQGDCNPAGFFGNNIHKPKHDTAHWRPASDPFGERTKRQTAACNCTRRGVSQESFFYEVVEGL
jgi:hypothetical protein